MVEAMRRLECTRCSSAATRMMVVCKRFGVVLRPCAVASPAPTRTMHSFGRSLTRHRLRPPGPGINRKRRS
jgi:hypothetical protein